MGDLRGEGREFQRKEVVNNGEMYLFRLLRASVCRCGNGFLFSQRPRPVSLWNEVPLTLIARRWPCAFFLSDSKGMLDVKDTVLRRELVSIALATR